MSLSQALLDIFSPKKYNIISNLKGGMLMDSTLFLYIVAVLGTLLLFILLTTFFWLKAIHPNFLHLPQKCKEYIWDNWKTVRLIYRILSCISAVVVCINAFINVYNAYDRFSFVSGWKFCFAFIIWFLLSACLGCIHYAILYWLEEEFGAPLHPIFFSLLLLISTTIAVLVAPDMLLNP